VAKYEARPINDPAPMLRNVPGKELPAPPPELVGISAKVMKFTWEKFKEIQYNMGKTGLNVSYADIIDKAVAEYYANHPDLHDVKEGKE
jgi:hypothetical protein